ncbi:hypothetical protein AVEN_109803-1 [Araneus ventricosus]|uniref:RNase H type-1 domain-containing protein n=1 Tax=Araneus ventricosus TaxID=182803 RepID=A0A4Y2TAF4_ARAVE|nr:hypothetical protein AVEN_109803-1 [Araneus ventricosus]
MSQSTCQSFMPKDNSFTFILSKSIDTSFKMPATDDEEMPDKGTDSSSTSLSSQKIPVVALSKVAGVGPIELLINDVIDFNFDPLVSEIAVLQELVKIYISKGRDIKAGSREIIVEKVIAPFLKIFKDRETTNLSTIYDLKASQLDITERQYQSKIRSCEATIESLNGKLNILCTELNDYKKDFKESSRSLIETTKEVKSLVSRATPSFASIVTRPSVTKPPVTTQRGNHVLLLRPKKESTSEDNRKRVETALVSRNSPIRINRISKVSRGGLIIEAPNKDELQALERELACVTTIDDHFEITRPKKRSPQIILIGVPRDVDKDRLSKGLSAKNIFLCDSSNKPLFELNFSMKTRFASNWVMTIDPAIYKRLFGLNNSYDLLVGDFNARSQVWGYGFEDHRGRAYADDLALILCASSRKNLELSVNTALDSLCDKLSNLNLRVASEKTLAVVFRGTQNKNKQKRGLATLKRPPIFKINNATIRTVDSVKYLGVIIDNRLNWTDHIDYLRSKMLNLIKNFISVSGPNWGVGASLLKHWYLSVIQPSILYGSAVWGGSFTVKNINTLFSIQRLALLKISKSYRTCPTNALNVFLGIPPLHVVAKGLFMKFQIWKLRSNGFDFIDIDNLDKFIEINNIELKYKILEFPSTIENSDFEVYTDGSGIDGNIGASVCIFNNDICINTFQFKLSSFNSVFQAELAAINFAAGWAVDNCARINIFTDSLSSIEALRKSKYLIEIKNNMFNAIGSVGLSWVKAHAGIPGNELADQYAKDAAVNGNFLAMPAPYSFLKKLLKSLFWIIGNNIGRTLKVVVGLGSLFHMWISLSLLTIEHRWYDSRTGLGIPELRRHLLELNKHYEFGKLKGLTED